MGDPKRLTTERWQRCVDAYRRGLLTEDELMRMAMIEYIYMLYDIERELDARLEDSRADIETRAKPQEVQ